MTGSIDKCELERFQTIVSNRLGLRPAENDLDCTADVLRRRLEAHAGVTVPSYLDLLESPRGVEEFRVLASELTTSETYFFRSPDHSRALIEIALPERIRRRAAAHRLRLLSAGCSSGEEPYSLAIILRENFPEIEAWDIHILAIDVNPRVLAKARKGKYGDWALRETRPEIRKKYFRESRGEYCIRENLRAMVSFEEQNLSGDCGWLALQPEFDIIFCRNVLMYFTPGAALRLVERLSQALCPEGYFFVGCVENLRGLTRHFHLRHTHDAFYYQKYSKSDIMPATPDPPVVIHGRVLQKETRQPAALQAKPSSFVDISAKRSRGNPETPRAHAIETGLALDLMRAERYREALDVLHLVSPDSSADPDSLLLKAVLLLNSGAPQRAEEICWKLLKTDDLSASAHYVMALCRESAGDAPGAMENDRAAVYLDPAFAMPHLHLGRMAKRIGDGKTAQHELEHAAMLLASEYPSRILLFGGGFGREVLVAAARAELVGVCYE